MTLSQQLIDKQAIGTKMEEAFQFLTETLTRDYTPEENLSDKTKVFLRNLELSDEQQRVARMNSTHLLVKGTAGSGKSITLLTRMMQKMSEEIGKRFLFVSFNEELVKDGRNRFMQSEYAKKLESQNHTVEFLTFHQLASKLLKSCGIKDVSWFRTDHASLNKKEDDQRRAMAFILKKLDTEEEFRELPSILTIKKTNNTAFLADEFAWMKGNGIISKEEYLTCERTGRGKLPNISVKQRITIFRLFEYYQMYQKQNYINRMDSEDYALRVMENINRIQDEDMYDHIFIDEVQDLQPMQLRVLVAINKGTLTLSGDERQRIYKSSPFSYQALGINIQSGNNAVLKINYRSTYEIMKLANSLQFKRTNEDSKYDDEKYFPRHGVKPLIRSFKKYNQMIDTIGEQIWEIYKEKPDATFAIVHRQHDENSYRALKLAFGKHFSFTTYIKKEEVQENDERLHGPKVFFMEAKTTKGLEFDYVFIMNFSSTYYPHQQEMINLDKLSFKHRRKAFDDDKRDIEEKEKRVLYVSLTRARQAVFLYFAGGDHPEEIISPFVKDFHVRDYEAKGFKKTMLE